MADIVAAAKSEGFPEYAAKQAMRGYPSKQIWSHKLNRTEHWRCLPGREPDGWEKGT